MTTWKVLITDGLSDKGIAILSSAAQVDNKPDISADDLLKVAGEYDAIVVRGRTKVTPAVFEAAKKLRVVGRAGVGVDNIDLTAARSKGVTVVNAPKSTSLAVAELALGMMFCLARMIPKADYTMKQGQWIKKQLEGIELNGKTLGIVGMGNIGTAIAHKAAALGMKTLGYDTLVSTEEIKKRGAEPTTLVDLYAKSDFITFHLPLSPESKGMVNGQAFAQMKRGVRIIDAARGGIIDETALVAALETGQVAAAALDVFATEPPGSTALVAHPNVVATPHIGAQTEEAQDRAAEDIASEVLNVLRGDPLRWKIV
ncbi:MAG TPA: hydroxyacid dehydrogenase [Anaerolineales bacterium]|nr:hydroxyacid dehydrogenase [Anaerolineales bacterium]